MSLIAAITACFSLAVVFGVNTEMLGVPALVGYLVASISISPANRCCVGDIPCLATF